VAISPDGEWLTTGSPGKNGIQVWRLRAATRVAQPRTEGYGNAQFSPEGKWLMTAGPPCRLWEVGTWSAGPEIGGEGLGFSLDGRLLVVRDPDTALRLVETETGHALARLTNPGRGEAWWATFSPDGSRLVVNDRDAHAVHVWDLRALRRQLAGMSLDWCAPAYSDDDPAAPSAPPLPPLQILPPADPIAQGPAPGSRGRGDEAAADWARAFAAGAPDRPYLWFERAILHLAVSDGAGYRSACQHLLDVLRRDEESAWLEYAAHACALAPEGSAEAAQALRLAERRAYLVPMTWSEHALGLALYRAGRFVESDARLRASLDRDPDWDYHVLNWMVLAMAQQRLGRSEQARSWLDRVERWVAARLRDRPGEADRSVPENWHWRDGLLLHLLLHEARALIGAGLPELPDDVFARPQ
jgi:tetratricopeptide (TPR) repeat protein